ncbi:MAG: hypothetical protein HY762_00675 [Planctomycetes bacterium]|nr:hypothetical protein [Planctomycetota bacterium]
MLTRLKLTNMALETEVIQINQAKLRKPFKGSNKPLSWSKRRGALGRQFCGREQELWSPEFYDEWAEYIRAVQRGELIG